MPVIDTRRTRDQLQDRLLRMRALRQDHQHPVHPSQDQPPCARQARLASPTEEERTLYFDFLSLELGTVKRHADPSASLHGARPRATTTPAASSSCRTSTASSSAPTRKYDASRRERGELPQPVGQPHGPRRRREAPLRDADEQARPGRHLRSPRSQRLAQPHRSPVVEACAVSGVGVFETLKLVSRQVIAGGT